MNVLFTFLINIIHYFKGIFKNPDYKIISRDLEYWVKPGEEYTTSDAFWEEQSNEWVEGVETYAVTLRKDEVVPKPPDVISKLLVRVKYFYNNRIYKYITYNHSYTWPPHVDKGMHFTIPLVSAHLMDAHGLPAKDVLNKIKRYAGPKGDFYGNEKIKIADMFYYDETTLKECYPKICLKNIFGTKKTVSTADGHISDLRIP